MIEAIAIDDELPALEIIKLFSEKSGLISLQKTFNKPTDGLKYVNKFPVDLLFLDINMPSLSGIDLAKELKQETKLIFTTAYSEFAVEGFNLNAVDYLLKPFTFERFMQAVNKANQQLNTPAIGNNSAAIYIRADYKLIRINLEDILFLEGLDDYLKIHLENAKPIVARMTIKNILERLPSPQFLRVHRSFVVNMNKIAGFKSKTIYIANDEIPVGNSFEEQFLEVFKQKN